MSFWKATICCGRRAFPACASSMATGTARCRDMGGRRSKARAWPAGEILKILVETAAAAVIFLPAISAPARRQRVPAGSTPTCRRRRQPERSPHRSAAAARAATRPVDQNPAGGWHSPSSAPLVLLPADSGDEIGATGNSWCCGQRRLTSGGRPLGKLNLWRPWAAVSGGPRCRGRGSICCGVAQDA